MHGALSKGESILLHSTLFSIYPTPPLLLSLHPSTSTKQRSVNTLISLPLSLTTTTLVYKRSQRLFTRNLDDQTTLTLHPTSRPYRLHQNHNMRFTIPFTAAAAILFALATPASANYNLSRRDDATNGTISIAQANGTATDDDDYECDDEDELVSSSITIASSTSAPVPSASAVSSDEEECDEEEEDEEEECDEDEDVPTPSQNAAAPSASASKLASTGEEEDCEEEEDESEEDETTDDEVANNNQGATSATSAIASNKVLAAAPSSSAFYSAAAAAAATGAPDVECAGVS